MNHVIKVNDSDFEDIKKTRKIFHLCIDKGFNVGDTVIFRNNNQDIDATIKYIQRKRTGLYDDFCIISFRVINQSYLYQ